MIPNVIFEQRLFDQQKIEFIEWLKRLCSLQRKGGIRVHLQADIWKCFSIITYNTLDKFALTVFVVNQGDVNVELGKRASMTESRFDIGMKVRKEVLGSEYVERAFARSTEFDADFQRFITEEAWSRLRFWRP